MTCTESPDRPKQCNLVMPRYKNFYIVDLYHDYHNMLNLVNSF